MMGKRVKGAWEYQSLTAPRGDGLSNRSSHEVQLRVDPIADFDEEVDGLRSQVAVLKGVAQEIESETRFQNDLLSQLETTMGKAQAGLTNTLRRLNRSLAANGSNTVTHVVLFVLLCFFCVYLWTKFFR